jgi:hypothetical protein
MNKLTKNISPNPTASPDFFCRADAFVTWIWAGENDELSLFRAARCIQGIQI